MDDGHRIVNDTPFLVFPYVVADEVYGGRMVVKDTPTNMNEGEPKGRVIIQASATTVKTPQGKQVKVHQQTPDAGL